MKTRMLLITIVSVTALMVIIAGGSKKKLSMDEAYDILAGTWINEEYSEVKSAYKIIVEPDGAYTGFPSMKTDITMTGRFEILDTMIDSDGSIWIKARNDAVRFDKNMKYYELQKYSNSNMTLEVWDSEVEDWWGEGFLTDLEPTDSVRYAYRIFYRQ